MRLKEDRIDRSCVPFLCFFDGWGAKSHLQTGWGQWPDFPRDPPVVNVNNRRRLRSLNISLLRAYTKYIGEQDALFVLQLTTSSHGPNTYYLVGRPM